MLFSPVKAWFDRDAAPAKPAALIAIVLDRIDHLPSLSDTVVKAMSLAKDENASLAEYISLIRRDAAVAASILKAANSVLYQGLHSVDNLDRAIIRLGMRGCTNVIASVGMKGLAKYANPQIQQRCELLLSHSFFTANLASGLNTDFKLGFFGEEFTAGLLHDIGRLVIAVSAPDAFEAADPTVFDENEQTPAREQLQIGTNHCTIGAEYAARNRLPESVISPIEFHHYSDKATGHGKLVELVAGADQLANHIFCSRKLNDLPWDRMAVLRKLMGVDASYDGSQLTERLAPIVVKAIRSTRAMLKSF